VGHPAFDHLAFAIDVYDQARQTNLLDPTSHSWPECLSLGAMLEMLRRDELKHCVQAVILFQAMMEKVPYFVPGIGSGIKPTNNERFACSWKDLLSQIKDPTARATANAAFDAYDTNFYKAFRNPIIHGKKAEDIKKVNEIRAPGVYDGMRQGWRAYDYLLTEAFAPEQTHEPSWATMCNAHGISNSLNLSNYPDLDDMQAQFNQKHLNGARAAMESGE
jgi:hypothetical protein